MSIQAQSVICDFTISENAVACIVEFRGTISINGRTHNAEQRLTDWQPILLFPEDEIRTDTDGWAAILARDETRMHLNNSSQLILHDVAPQAGWLPVSLRRIGQSIYELLGGEVRIDNNNVNIDVEVRSLKLIASIRGTEFVLRTESDQSVLTVLEGQVLATHVENPQDQLNAESGDRVTARTGEPLLLERLQIDPTDAVQWVFFIPPLFEQSVNPGNRAAINRLAPVLPVRKVATHQSVQVHVAQSDNQTLQTGLQQAYSDLQNQHLSAAQARLQNLTERYPRQAIAWRLLALTQLVLNRKQLALESAQQAVIQAPDSPAALVTLAYVHQAMFDLPKAMALTQQALQYDPDNILALTQLSRLQFGSDDAESAWRSLNRALQLAPDQAEVHNLRGFLLLARSDTAEAIDAFQQAIVLERRLGEPHLGLGLAYMRQGLTGQALQSMATAVLLEPRRSLLMSYWGKMLYQVKRFDRALELFDIAHRYDDQDPTPLLYQGLIFRDLNQPSTAIRSLNQAIRLNDRRAVYRSQFLLDRDLAIKNADLSEIYRQLGLDAWARSKAIASVKQDYTNSSAHAFLAGALAEEEDRAWPQSSEALLGRLLQSGSVNSFNTYNDYTALLEQPATNGDYSIATGTQSRFDNQLFVYGSLPDKSLNFGLGATYFDNNGWRDSNGQRFKDLSGIAKWDITPSDSLLFSASYSKLIRKDEDFPRFEYDFPADPVEVIDSDFNRFEIGYHHHFGPKADFLLYFNRTNFHSERREHFTTSLDELNRTIDTLNNIDAESPYYQAQGQYMYGIGDHQLIVGTLHYWIDTEIHSRVRDELSDATTGEFISEGTSERSSQFETRFHNYYFQDIWHFHENWKLEAALYFERFADGDRSDQSEFNPRLGLVWTPTHKDTFRIAAFRYLLPRISPRIDPTDIAGVTLFRNGLEGTLTEEADFVWEREWDSGFFSANLFYQKREFAIGEESEQGVIKGMELELNQLLPWEGTGLAASYRYLDVEENDLVKFINDNQSFTDNPVFSDRQEHLFKLEFNYVNANGISAGFSQTYRNIDSVAADRPDEDIWVTDVSFAYEFPDKWGSLSFEMRNVFDSQFNWVTDPLASVIDFPAPEREIFATFSINF